MNRRLWVNLSLAALVLVLAAAVWVEHYLSPPPPEPKLTDIDTKQIHQITIARPGEADIVLQRRGQTWWMRKPLEVAANQPRITALLAILTQNRYGDFPVSQMDLAGIGLAPPRVSVRYDQTRVDFGATEPLNKHRYVRIGDRVLLTDDDNFYSLIAQRDHYISLAILNPDQQLSRISLPGLALYKSGQGWQLDSEQKPGSGDDIMRLVQTWQSASALEVHPREHGSIEGKPVITLGLTAQQAPIKLVILKRKPDLILWRPDKHLQYQFTAHQAEQMLQLSPDQD